MVAADKRPRKRPTQSRAQLTFDSIIQAADQLLDEVPLQSVTVQAIADRAGVSVGSLYQYFPTKDAIVATVIEQDVERVFQALELVYQSTSKLPLQEMLRMMIRGLVAMYASRPNYYRSILPEIGRLERDKVIRSAAIRSEEIVAHAIEQRRGELDVSPERLASLQFIVARIPNLLAHAVVIERPELLNTQTFADELVHLTLGYLLESPRS